MAVPGHVQRAAERLAGPLDDLPIAALVGPDGTGRTETLAALANILADRGVAEVRVAGRRADRDVALAALSPALGPNVKDTRAARELLEDSLAAEGTVLVVDDAHLLDDASVEVLLALTDDARARRFGVVIAASPTVPGRDDPMTAAIARTGTVVRTAPADEDDVAERAERILGTPPDAAVVDLLLARACGHARLTDRLVTAWRDAGFVERGSIVSDPDPTPAEVVDPITAVTAELTPEARAALTALAIGPALDDALLTALSDGPTDSAPALWQELRAAGLLVPEHEEPLPIVADAVATRVDPATRRELHRRVADLLAERGAPAAQVADHLVAAEARGPDTARVLVDAGEAALAEAPEVASDLLARAVDAGVDPALVAGERAEAAALSGDEDAAIALADGAIGGPAESTARAELVLAGVLARRGLWDRSVRSYGSIIEHPRLPDDAVRALGSVATAALGRAGDAPADDRAPPGSLAADVARLLGNAARAAAVGDAVAARRAAGEAADLVESSAVPIVLPETPHALAALVALAAGDSEDAERMATRALDCEIGGPAATQRHRLLRGFAAMRAGRWDRAQHALDAAGGRCTTRDALLRGALGAALARRSGDVARLVESWGTVAAPLGAVHGDLFLVLPLAELVVVAARLGRREQLAPREQELDGVLDGLGHPGLWARPLAWARVEAAVAGDDPDGLAAASAVLATTTPASERLQGLDAAAAAWQRVLAGSSDGLDDGVAGLEQAGLVWEASRLVGQAAIRAADPGQTRSLLGRARELKGTLPVLDESGAPTGTVLSAREQEVAACVVDGLTHKEIGAMLFISPKTVEHHVARIRQKLGATSRAELLAGLRTTLAAAD